MNISIPDLIRMRFRLIEVAVFGDPITYDDLSMTLFNRHYKFNGPISKKIFPINSSPKLLDITGIPSQSIIIG